MKCRWLILFSFLPFFTSAQDIAITMSVNWRTGQDIFYPDSMMVYPELLVTYSNLSENCYYFKKVADKRMEYPITFGGANFYYPHGKPDVEFLAKAHSDYSAKKMIVRLMNWRPSWENNCDVFMEETYDKAVIKGEEYEPDWINDALTDIHGYLHHSDTASWNTIKYLFPTALDAQRMRDSMDVVILENCERFVFLEPYQSVTDTFNLVAFAECGGQYRFELSKDSLSGFLPVYTQARPGFEDVPMPETIGKYKLYFGKVLTNQVIVDLKGKRRKH